MLERLIESRPIRRRATRQLAASATLHTAVLILAMSATRGVAAPRDDRRPPPASFVVGVAPPPETAGPAAGGSDGLTASPSPFADPVLPSVGTVDISLGLPLITVDPGPAGSAIPGMAGAQHVPLPPLVPPGQRVVEVDVPVVPIDGPRPRYPAELRAAGVEGVVRVRFVVTVTGVVDSASIAVVHSSHSGFDAAAVSTIRQWRYRPARLYGVTVAQLVERNVRFRLED